MAKSTKVFDRTSRQEELREMTRALPQGDWNWPGSDLVSRNLQKGAQTLASWAYLGDLHVKTMAVLGCGNEETCKAHQLILIQYGYI